MHRGNRNDPPLSKAEVAAWVEVLGKTDQARIVTIRQLLKNKCGDRMSPEDEAICRAELERLVKEVK